MVLDKLNLNRIKILPKKDSTFSIKIDGKEIKDIEIIQIESGKNLIFFKLNNLIYKAKITKNQNQFDTYIFNFDRNFTITSESSKVSQEKISSDIFKENLQSPLAGRVIKIHVKPNDFVKKNQPLIVIESMKMENEIRACGDAFIKNILISNQDLVKQDQILIVFEKGVEKNAEPKSSH